MWLAIAVMTLSGVVNLIVSQMVLYPVARRTQSAVLEADAAHLRTDVYTSFGVAGGLLLDEALPEKELEEIRRCVKDQRGGLI